MARAKTELFPEPIRELSAFARALGHPARLSVVKLLLDRGETPAMELVRGLPLSQPACSRHLEVLHKAGIVRVRASGAQVFYSLNKSFVRSRSKALQRMVTSKQ